jgi:hypothetical protein
MDKKNKKRKYVKPKITKIRLDAQAAVLASCKAAGISSGPLNNSCRGGMFGVCREQGS